MGWPAYDTTEVRRLPEGTGDLADGLRAVISILLPAYNAAVTLPTALVRSAGAREAIETRLRAAGYRLGVDYILAA